MAVKAHRLISSGLLVALCPVLPSSATAGSTTFSSEAQFLAAAPICHLESFELLPAGRCVPSIDFDGVTISGTLPGIRIRDDATCLSATDGVQFLGPCGIPDDTETFTFVRPIRAFGINISGFGDTGPTGNVVFQTETGLDILVASAPLPGCNHLFFGVILHEPASVVTITQTEPLGGSNFDELYFALLGDLNGDIDVDSADLGILLGAWGSSDPSADFNGDGTVGASDLAILLGEWTG